MLPNFLFNFLPPVNSNVASKKENAKYPIKRGLDILWHTHVILHNNLLMIL